MARGIYSLFLKRPLKKWPVTGLWKISVVDFFMFCKIRRKHSLIFIRHIGSSGASVDKDSLKKKVDLKYPEKKLRVYTCEHIYDSWRKQRKFFTIPSSGVYATIPFVDTVGHEDSENRVITHDATTVLCVHGIPGNYGVFNHLITELGARGTRAVVPTFPDSLYLPGLNNKKELFRHSVEEKTQVFKDFLKELNISRLDAIIAHSSAVYPALRLALDPELDVKCQIFFNTGGHKKTVTMRPYWIVWTCSYLYLFPLTRKLVQKTGKFIMKYILRTPIKDDNFDGIMLLAITMVFSEYWKAKEQFLEVKEKQFPTLLCFSENDKVVERELTYEVISLLGATARNITYYDENANIKKDGDQKSWLRLISFEKGSHYVFRKHPEICNKMVLDMLKEFANSNHNL